MTTHSLSVSIVIPNWNGSKLLQKNLPAVLQAAGSAEIIVADDASSDDSLSILKTMFPGVIRVANKKQVGFAGNVNSGVAKATGDIVVLLNTDVRPEKDFLAPLLEAFAQDPKLAAVGCLEKSHEKNGIVLRGRGVARWEKGFFIHAKGETTKTDTAWVSGGSAAYRRTIWNTLGGMDTIYNPFYWEDIDLSYQIRKAGYFLRFEPKSIVHHFHEEGAIKTSYSPDAIKRIVYRNQFLFLWKNISDVPLWLAHCRWMPVRLVQAAIVGDRAMLYGYAMVLFMFPSLYKSRLRAARHWKCRDLSLYTS